MSEKTERFETLDGDPVRTEAEAYRYMIDAALLWILLAVRRLPVPDALTFGMRYVAGDRSLRLVLDTCGDRVLGVELYQLRDGAFASLCGRRDLLTAAASPDARPN